MSEQNGTGTTDVQRAEEASTGPASADDVNDPQNAPQRPERADTGDSAQTDAGPGREAARYRKKLRATEAERDKLSEQVETLQRKEVEQLAADRLETPADLWLVDTELSELVDVDGAVDAERVNATIDQILADRPGWQRSTAPTYDGGARTSTSPAPSWQAILRGNHR